MEIKKKKKINIFRIQANDSIMCGYSRVGFVDLMLAGKILVDDTGLFSWFLKNDNITLNVFKNE